MIEPQESTRNLARQRQSDARKRVQPCNPFVEFGAEEIEQSIPARFEQQAAKHPNKLAIVSKRHRVAYGELNQAANRVARAILAHRGEGDETTAFLLGSGAPALTAILGILKAGKALVGLDPASPIGRNTYVLQHAQARLIVTDNDHLSPARELAGSGVSIINIDEPALLLSGENIGLPIAPDDLATVVYTSGSSGQPKGVIQTHRNLLSSAMVYTNRLRHCADDRAVILFSLAFMGGVSASLKYLLVGACLCPFDVKQQGIHALANWLVEQEATILSSNPTTFRHFIRTLGGEEKFPKLRLVSLGGEVLYPKDVEMYKKHFAPSCLLGNGMGATESLSVCHYLMDKKTQITTSAVPVGYEFEGRQVLLLDEAGRDVGINRIGRIVVKSRYLSPGYWRNPELTQAAFLPDPGGGDERLYEMGDLGLRLADGCLVHLGREDYQVKIRGYRVEVVEVEMALLALESIKEAVVVPREDKRGEKRLVAYLVPASGSVPTVSELRRALVDRLPDFMIPSAFVMLESLPLGATGKVDRLALPEPAPIRPELGSPFVAPRNDKEAQLAGIWEAVLGIRPIGVQDSFLELGGSSLDYLSLLLQIERVFGTTLSLAEVGQGPTIAHLAELLEQQDNLTILLPLSSRGHRLSDYLETGLKRIASGGVQRVISKMGFRRGPVLGNTAIPYATGARFLSWFCGRRWIQSILFRRQVRLVQECLALVNDSANDQLDVVRQSLVCNLWGRWRRVALSQSTSEEFERWVTVTGFRILDESLLNGNGVVLIRSHLASLNVLRTLLHRRGLDDIFGVGYRYSFFDVPESLSLGNQLYEAKRVLKRGGIVMIVPDGYMGSSGGIESSLFGRRRTFRTGFAELALSTGAPIVPASASIDVTGHVHVRFSPPLTTDTVSHEQQIESLVSQYVEILRREWAENLGSFRWAHLEKLLQLPPVVESMSRTC